MTLKPADLLSNGTKEIRLLIDWLSITNHWNIEKKEFVAHPLLHDWDNWELTRGVNGYSEGARHKEHGVKVFRNPMRQDMGIHVIYSGKSLKGIKKVYDLGEFEILKYHIDSGDSVTRIDIALDFMNCGVSVADFQWAWERKLAVTRLRAASVVLDLEGEGHTLYIGSTKTRKKLVKVYNKAAEQNLKGDWTRVEIQIMGKPATSLSKIAVESSDPKSFLMYAIKGVIHFPTVACWTDIFDNVEAVKIGSIDNKGAKTREWLEKQVFPALVKEIKLDASWWIQYKLGLEHLVEKETK